jgi:hypothetical protein
MSKKMWTLLSMVSAMALMFVAIAQADEKKMDEAAAKDAAMKAEMAKIAEWTTPGAEHAVLKVLEGNWTVSSRFWMKPGDKEEKSTATSSFSWVLNGRFLNQKYNGDWQGQPFEGWGTVGYDKIRKEYVTTWLDNMSTGLMHATAQYDAKAKTFNESGNYSCPFTGEKDKWFRSEWTIKNDNKTVYTMWIKDEKGKEFKSMELNYERVKA